MKNESHEKDGLDWPARREKERKSWGLQDHITVHTVKRKGLVAFRLPRSPSNAHAAQLPSV